MFKRFLVTFVMIRMLLGQSFGVWNDFGIVLRCFQWFWVSLPTFEMILESFSDVWNDVGIVFWCLDRCWNGLSMFGVIFVLMYRCLKWFHDGFLMLKMISSWSFDVWSDFGMESWCSEWFWVSPMVLRMSLWWICDV